jgi:hypothetical protein
VRVFLNFASATIDVSVNAVKITAGHAEQLASSQGARVTSDVDVHAVIEPQ